MADKETDRSKQLSTLAVRTGHHRTAEQEHSEPLFMTSSFVFDNAEQAAARFSYAEPGNVYSRFTNPTVQAFEERLAVMEGGDACMATSSGMAAIMTVCLATLKAGDHVVAAKAMFGATKVLFDQLLAKFDVDITFVDMTDLSAWQEAMQTNTRLVFFETPTNPLMEIADIQSISDIAHQYNSEILVVVDNCFCTPVLQRPLSLGADIVIHSATKLIDGQGRCIGGAIVASRELVDDCLFPFMRTAGPSLSPFNAWVFLKGLETLSLRVNHSSDNALQLAQWLEQQVGIERVYYPSLDSHPQQALANKQQSKGGSIVSFVLSGGQEAAWQLINNTKLLSITANLGDAKTTITHPATTTHARWSEQDKLEAGIVPGLVRISVGLEAIEDIQEDLRF